MDELKVLAQRENCTVFDVPGDGNCLFSALALQLQRTFPESAKEVRGELVAYITEHSEMANRAKFSVIYLMF